MPETSENLAGTVPLRLLGGPRSLARFASLLGLGGQELAQLNRISWMEDSFLLELTQSGAGTISLVLEASRGADQKRPFINTPHLDLWYRDGQMVQGLEDALHRAAEDFGELTVTVLLEELVKDPETKKLARQAPAAARTDRVKDVGGSGDQAAGPDGPGQDSSRPGNDEKRGQLGTWNLDETFCDFLAVDALEMFPFESIEASNPFLRISHSDLECHCFMPREKAANPTMVDYPWIYEGQEQDDAIKGMETTLSTDLTEHEVIMGCNPKVIQVMDHALARGEGKPIIFTNTCLPATTSEDVVSLLERYKEKTELNIVVHNRAKAEGDSQDMLSSMLVDRRLAAQARIDKLEPDAVNLVGFTRDDSLDELSQALSVMGLRLNRAILPRIEPEDMDSFPRAATNVFLRVTRCWESFFKQIDQDSRARSIAPAGPFGIAGTKSWLSAIAAEVAVETDPDAAFSQLFEPLAERWEELTREASQFRLGLVVGAADVEHLADPACSNGIPLLPLLEEMGFELELFLRPAGLSARDRAAPLLELLKNPERCELTPFDDLPALRQALRDSEAQAIFSNYRFDWRLSEAGKNRISLRHFSKGMAGAVRSAESLLGTCRQRFYSRYAKYFSRTAMGLRSPGS